MPNLAADIIVTGCQIFHSPLATALPATTLAVGAAWPVGWVNVGYTLEPVKLSYKFNPLEVSVQQLSSPVKSIRISEVAMLDTVLAEHSATNLALAMAGEATSDATTQTFTIGGSPVIPRLQWGFEGTYVDDDNDSFPIRAYAWIGQLADGSDLEYNREKPTGISLRIRIMSDYSKPVGQQLFKIVRTIAAA